MDLTKKDSGASFDSTHILLFIYKWRKPILMITGLATVISIIVSLLIPNKYKSTVILFPTTTSSISKALLSENPGVKNDILLFGEEEEAEQMIQILNSDEIRTRISNKYNLMTHYDIDSTSDIAQTLLMKQYESNVTVQRTEYMSVRIDVMDEDPLFAANIANDVAAYYDSTKQRIRKERAIQGLMIVERTYLKLKSEVMQMQDSLNKLMKLGVNDYESQAERLNEYINKAVLEGKTAAVKTLQDQLKVISMYGEAYMSLRDNLEFQRKNLSEIKAKYEQAKVDAEQNLPDKFVVNSAFPAERKSYPVRWLIVVSSAVSAFLLGVLFLIVFENIKKIKSRI